MHTQFAKLHKKLALVSVAQLATVPAVMVPVLYKRSEPIEIQLTHKDVVDIIDLYKEETMEELRRLRKTNIANAVALYGSFNTLVEQLAKQYEEQSEKLALLEKKLNENKQETKRVFDLVDQVLDLIDEQTDFIEKWFDITDAYNSHIYTELLEVKDRQADAFTYLSDLYYDVVDTNLAVDEGFKRAEHNQALLWELGCLANKSGLMSNTSINLAFKDYLLKSCGVVEAASVDG